MPTAETAQSAHTPGPWLYNGDHGYADWNGHRVLTEQSPPYVLAVAIGDVPDLARCAEANARLIAAAPELLAALEKCALMLKAHKIDCTERDLARAAIRKATGAE